MFGRITAPRDAWLARQPAEPILEPDLPIIDTHHHLWDRGGHRYFLDEFLADARTGHTIVATVFVECHAMYRAPVLEAHLRAGGGRFKGVRHSAAWDADEVIGNSRTANGPHLFAQKNFRDGLARLTALGLSLDAWQFHPQLPGTIDLARAMPNANIIVGHCGGPLGYGVYAGKKD